MDLETNYFNLSSSGSKQADGYLNMRGSEYVPMTPGSDDAKASRKPGPPLPIVKAPSRRNEYVPVHLSGKAVSTPPAKHKLVNETSSNDENSNNTSPGQYSNVSPGQHSDTSPGQPSNTSLGQYSNSKPPRPESLTEDDHYLRPVSQRGQSSVPQPDVTLRHKPVTAAGDSPAVHSDYIPENNQRPPNYSAVMIDRADEVTV